MTKRLAGRPKGARNKLNATDEIRKAISRGQGLVELKQWLWEEMQKDSVTDLQKSKYAAMYADIMKYIHSESLKIELKEVTEKVESVKSVVQGENTKNTPAKDDTGVYKLSFGK